MFTPSLSGHLVNASSFPLMFSWPCVWTLPLLSHPLRKHSRVWPNSYLITEMKINACPLLLSVRLYLTTVPDPPSPARSGVHPLGVSVVFCTGWLIMVCLCQSQPAWVIISLLYPYILFVGCLLLIEGMAWLSWWHKDIKPVVRWAKEWSLCALGLMNQPSLNWMG